MIWRPPSSFCGRCGECKRSHALSYPPHYQDDEDDNEDGEDDNDGEDGNNDLSIIFSIPLLWRR